MPDAPLVLGFDTSVAHCAAALILGTEILAERHEDMARGQSERLFGLLQDVLDDAQKSWADLAAIGVGIGPGNFTGIRLSVAAARGLALSLSVPAIGVSRFEALAEGHATPILTSLDAKRQEFYISYCDGTNEPDSHLIQNIDIPKQYWGDTLLCVGDQSEQIAAFTGGQQAGPIYSLPVAIARIALRRIDHINPRPAPLYIRHPDAAPSRDAKPAHLP